jgi:sarcosine oxidase/L-pipecolate oxidase
MLPYVDLLTPRLGVALGGNGYAAKSSDAIGKLAADLVIDGEWTSDLPQEKLRFQAKMDAKL